MQWCLGNKNLPGRRRNECTSHLKEALEGERIEGAVGVLGERTCNGKSFWNLHWYHNTWRKKSLHVLRACSSGCVPLRRGTCLGGHRLGAQRSIVCADRGVAVRGRGSHSCRANIKSLSDRDGLDGFPTWRSLREECSRLSILSSDHTYFLYRSVFCNLQLKYRVKLHLELVENKWLFIIIIIIIKLGLSGQHFWEVKFA